MAKTVTHAIEFVDPIQPDLGPDRILYVVRCGDGSVYEFQRMEDAPLWNLRSRGNTSEPVHSWTTRSAPLPTDVIETLNEELGVGKWKK